MGCLEGTQIAVAIGCRALLPWHLDLHPNHGRRYSMNKLHLRVGGLALLAGFLAVPAAQADLLVSGDSNLGNGLTIAGNQQFFSNLLGSGTNVVFQTTTHTGDPTETMSQADIISYLTSKGATVTQVSTVTAANLAGASLFISFLPDTAYTGAEESAIQDRKS